MQCTPFKQKLKNQITSCLISFQYFVHPPGVASTARYCVLIDNMCLWKYTWSIGFKSKTFAGHLSFCTLFGTLIISNCASSHVSWCVVPCQQHTEIFTDMKKKNRPNDVISIPHRSYVSLNGVLVCMKTLDRVLLCLFARYLMFFIIDNQLGILSYQIRQLPCHARGARAHNLCSHLPFRMDSFVHGNVLFLSVIR